MIHICAELNPSTVDLPFRSTDSCVRKDCSVFCVWCHRNRIPFGDPELDQPNCTLGYAPERNTEVKCELFLHCHTGVEFVLLFNWHVKALLSKLEMAVWWFFNLNWVHLKNGLCTDVKLKKPRKIYFCIALDEGKVIICLWYKICPFFTIIYS